MESKLYNQSGKEIGTFDAPENIFGLPWNADLVHQVVVSMQANARPNVANTKDRGQVRGGGKKPWQQKGTGRARHGSSRSPIWKGGGVTHGPKAAKMYARKINRSMSQKALLTVLSRKYKEGEVIFIDRLEMQAPKASAGKAMLAAFGKHFSGFAKSKNAAPRHGSSRSPIWKGGGVTHGPKAAKMYARKINRSMSQKALLTVLSRKYKEGEVIFIDKLEMQAPKASAGKAMLTAFGKHFSGFAKSKNAALLALPVRHTPTIKSFQNFGNIAVEEVRNLNPLAILSAKYLVIAGPKDAVDMLGKKVK